VALLTITLNGNEVRVPEGVTILEAARLHGIEIPTLCDDGQLEPFASCWLCVVKLEGMRRYIPSCGTRVAQGMKIWTDSEDVIAVRRMALELLLSNHRGDCIPPCKAKCPAGVDVQGYIALIAKGEYREATKLVKEVNPFPLAIGRVCPRPCEKECRRNAVDGPVGIDYLKRFAADRDIADGTPWSPEIAPPTGKKVAAVGAGPASLTAAYYLAQLGHAVTVFEALPKPGGMLRYGIPEYRLPKATLDTEIGLILKLGVRLECGKALGRDFTLADLFARGFNAVFLGLGAMAERKMQVPGEDLEGVWAGTEFLTGVVLGEKVAMGKRVAIIGGGNTAIDAARTCVRLGAEKVTIVYRRSRTEMPAWDVEVDAAEHEGVEMHFLAAPTRIEGDGRCRRMECIRMELGEPDESGRRRPVPAKGSEFLIEVDNVIAAIGQFPDLSAIQDTASKDPDALEAGIALTRWGTIVADDKTGVTAVPGVFAGGDVVAGAATAIEAIAAGGKAAAAIDRHLRGERVALTKPFFNIKKERWDAFPEEDLAEVERKPRREMPELPVEARVRSFEEVELGYTESDAREEATRCLECGCIAAFTCKLREYSALYGASYETFGGDVIRDRPDERHPFIRYEPEKCILCARCIRVCEEVEGASALGFFRRGFYAQMKPALDKPFAATTCEACGQCVSTCPTAALTAVADLPKPGPWDLASTRSTCTFCGTGCAISLNTRGGSLVTVTPAGGSGVNEKNLCVRGRFGSVTVTAPDRLDRPIVRDGTSEKAASWGDAIGLAARRLAGVAGDRGPDSIAVLGSPRLTNEEAYFLQKLARVGLSTGNVGSFGLALEERVFGALRRAFGRGASTASYEDLASAEVVLLVDSDIAEEQTVAGLAVRRAVHRGARLVVISPGETRMTRIADVWIPAERSRTGDILAAMIDRARKRGGDAHGGVDGLAELLAGVPAGRAERLRSSIPDSLAALDQATDAFVSAGRAVLVANATSFDAASAERDAALAVALAVVAGKATRPGSGILFLRARANGQGITDAGLVPGLLPGQLAVGDAGARGRLERLYGRPVPTSAGSPDLFAAIESGSVTAALIVGEDPVGGSDDPERVRKALSKLAFLAVLDAVPTATTALAHVVLPLATAIETQGSFTASENRVRPVAGPLAPPSGLSNLEILARIALALGRPIGEPDPALVRREFALAAPALGFPGNGLDPSGHTIGRLPSDASRLAPPAGRVVLAAPPGAGPLVTFDPRWTDALEAAFARRVEELGLPPHVVRRLGL
jgi:formate dehydrogenase major subunit